MNPKNLFQILITADGDPSALPAEIEANAASLRQHHPDHAYHRLNEADLDASISAHFEAGVLAAFRGFRPYAYKADLARYCLLLVHGGVYADMAMRVVRRLELPDGKAMLCFRDTPGTGLWTVSNGLIVSQAGRDELRLAIELVRANYEARYYGPDPLSPTGPAAFGRALAITNRLEEIAVGAFDFLTNDRNMHNLGYTDAAGRIVALRWKSGQFREVGIEGTNNYSDMWMARAIYAEDLEGSDR